MEAQAHPGGAAAQCRFSGRCAIPIATTAPVDGSPLRKPDRRCPVPAGRTCRDPDAASSTAPALPPQPARGPASGTPSTAEFTSKWRFDLKTWEWRLIDGSAAEASSAEAAAARSVLPAANEASAAAGSTPVSLSRRRASAAASTKSKACAYASTLFRSFHRTSLVPDACALGTTPNTAALKFCSGLINMQEHRNNIEDGHAN